jgi:hypothetical protein
MRNFLAIVVVMLMLSCSPRRITTRYYEENQVALDKIEASYTSVSKKVPFSIAYTDKNFRNLTLEIDTDTLSYVYQFAAGEKRIADTLKKYKIDPAPALSIMESMKKIRCTWINKFDQYIDGKKKPVVFMSVKPVGLSGRFSSKRYYIITYFNQDQYYDSEGRLVNNRKQWQLQKLNGEIFHRINSKVCFTVSSSFR